MRHVLAHQSGLLTLREPQPAGALLDWERLVALLAAEPPHFEPGTRCGEQALFHGHLVGELVRRVDGRSLGRFFADEVAGPWGLDFHFGLAAAEQQRCARILDEGGAWRRSLDDDPRPLLVPALDNPPGALDVDVVNSPAYRAAEVPAVNGHGPPAPSRASTAASRLAVRACSCRRRSTRRCVRGQSATTCCWSRR